MKSKKRLQQSAQDRALGLIRKAIIKGNWRDLVDNGIPEFSVSELAYDADLERQTESFQDILDELSSADFTDPIAGKIQERIREISDNFDAWTLPNKAAHNMFNILISIFLNLKPTISLDLSRLQKGARHE